MEIPVYLFTGFLESGKTKFIQETLEDEKFNPHERTLLIVCEEGIEEYDKDKFKVKNVAIETVEDVSEFSPSVLSKVAKRHKAERVIIEYNGMWKLQDLYNALPDNFIIYQQVMFANAETFISYNKNMRELTVDKLNDAELVAINRKSDKTDKETIHKIIRGINRRCTILYEDWMGEVEYDDIKDPLPFDVKAPIIEIADKDYAIWYRDLMEEPGKYEGRTVRFKGLVARNKVLGDDTMLIGRKIMTCCEEDIAFRPIISESDEVIEAENAMWYTLTARIFMKKHKFYAEVGPILKYIKCEKAEAPEEDVTTFY